MVSVSLLQRLEGTGIAPASGGDGNDESAVMDSVLANLRVVLNARAGCCETRPDFGLSDFNATTVSYRSMAGDIARDVENQIRLFEPRLRQVVVRPVADRSLGLDLVFHVSAELAYEDRAVRVRFDSVLGSDGHIRFNG